MNHFRSYNKEDVLSLTRMRRFETKLGERINTTKGNDLPASIHAITAKYVLLGIPENIGVKANYGVGGTASCWIPFCRTVVGMSIKVDTINLQQRIFLGLL